MSSSFTALNNDVNTFLDRTINNKTVDDFLEETIQDLDEFLKDDKNQSVSTYKEKLHVLMLSLKCFKLSMTDQDKASEEARDSSRRQSGSNDSEGSWEQIEVAEEKKEADDIRKFLKQATLWFIDSIPFESSTPDEILTKKYSVTGNFENRSVAIAVDDKNLTVCTPNETTTDTLNKIKTEDLVTLKEIKSKAMASDEMKLSWIFKTRKLLSRRFDESQIDGFLQTGLLPILVDSLWIDNKAIQKEAAWVIANIASGTAEHTDAVVNANAIKPLIQLLSSNDWDLKKEAAWALGNIIGENVNYRNNCLNMEMIHRIRESVTPETPLSCLRCFAWVLVNTSRDVTCPLYRVIAYLCIQILSDLIQIDDVEIIQDSVWALSYICEMNGQYIDFIVVYNILPRLLTFMTHSNDDIQIAVIRTLEAIIKNDPKICLSYSQELLENLQYCFTKASKKVIPKALAFLSCLSSTYTSSQAESVFRSPIIQILLETINNEDVNDQNIVNKIIKNLIKKLQNENISCLMDNNFLSVYCQLLNSNNPKVVASVVRRIGDIFEIAGEHAPEIHKRIIEARGLELLKGLLGKDDATISPLLKSKVEELLKKYFAAQTQMSLPTSEAQSNLSEGQDDQMITETVDEIIENMEIDDTVTIF